MSEVKKFSPEEREEKELARKREDFKCAVGDFNRVIEENSHYLHGLYDETDLFRGGFNDGTYGHSSSNEVITRLLDWIKNDPDIVIEQVDSIQRERLREGVIELMAVSIGIKDPERGKQFYIDHHPYKDQPEAEAMMASDLYVNFYSPVARGMLAGDIDAAVAYARENDVIRDDPNGILNSEGFWLREGASRIVQDDPMHALEIFERAYEQLDLAEQDSRRPKKLRVHSQFLVSVAKALLDTDPDKALEVMMRVHDDPEELSSGTFNFRDRVMDSKLKIAIDTNDVFRAHELIQEINNGRSSHKVPFDLENQFFTLAQIKTLMMFDNGDLESVRKIFDFVPVQSETFNSVCIEMFLTGEDECIETPTGGYLVTEDEKIKNNQIVADHLKEFPEVVAFTMLQGRRPRSRSGSGRGRNISRGIKDWFPPGDRSPEKHKRDRAKAAWTSESRRKIFLATTKLEHHSELAAGFLPDDFPSDKKLGPERTAELKGALFETYKTHRRELLFQYAEYFKDQFAEMDEGEFNALFDGLESLSNRVLFGALAFIPRLDDSVTADLVGSVIDHGEFALFYKYASAFDRLPITQEQALIMAVVKKPDSFMDFYFKKREMFAVRSDISLKEGDKHLPNVVRHTLVDRLVETFPWKLLYLMSQKDKLDLSDYTFREEKVQAGYAEILKHNLGIMEALFTDLEELTSIAPDRAKVADAYLQTSPSFGELRLVSRDVPWLSEHFPWGSSIKSLEKVQAPAANAEHDPWKTDLEPLITKMTDRYEISFESEEDGGFVLDFVKEFGMINAPDLFRVYIDLRRAKKKEDLGEVAQVQLERFIGKKRFAKLDTPADLMNELRIKKRNLVTELLDDRGVPEELDTSLGKEIFSSVTGATRWGRDKSMEDTLGLWRDTIQEAKIAKSFTEPEVEARDRTKLPEGYNERILELRKRKRKETGKEARVKKEEAKKKICVNRAVEIEVKRILGGVREYGKFDFSDLAKNNVNEVKNVLEKKMSAASERADRLGERAPKGLLDNIEKQKLKLEAFNVFREEADRFFSEGEDQDVIQYLMESFAELDLKFEAADEYLRLLSVHHLLGFEQDAYTEILDEVNAVHSEWRFDTNWTEKGVGMDQEELERLNDFLVNFLAEHYLNPNQKHHNVDHPAFSKALLWSLNRLWGLPQTQKPEEMAKHPLAKAVRQLRELDRGDTLSDDIMEVAMVPSQGVLRIFSGDTGDACFTSRHGDLAQGKYPDLHAYTFVTGRDTPHERFAGSVLFVEATKESEDQEPVLIVRASNPRENLIQAVDEEELIRGILEEAIEVAKRRGIPNVVVPLDRASASCSNRPAVARYYSKHFGSNNKIGLKDTPETRFNGYDNWNIIGQFPVVEIWSEGSGKIGSW